MPHAHKNKKIPWMQIYFCCQTYNTHILFSNFYFITAVLFLLFLVRNIVMKHDEIKKTGRRGGVRRLAESIHFQKVESIIKEIAYVIYTCRRTHIDSCKIVTRRRLMKIPRASVFGVREIDLSPVRQRGLFHDLSIEPRIYIYESE